MRLNLKQIRNAVKDTINEEKVIDQLRAEVKSKLGPIMNVNVHVERLAEHVNDRLDVLELTGRTIPSFKQSILLKLANHTSDDVRKMVVRLLPENMMIKHAKDRSSIVRKVVAKRAPLNIVEKMTKIFPNDDEVDLIFSSRKLSENFTFEPTLKHHTERLGDSGKSYSIDLSNTWYDNKAFEIICDYNKYGVLDSPWEEKAVNNFCSHTKATSGIDIDPNKLMDAINRQLTDSDDLALKRDELKETFEHSPGSYEPEKQDAMMMDDDELMMKIDKYRELAMGYPDSKLHDINSIQSKLTALEDEAELRGLL